MNPLESSDTPVVEMNKSIMNNPYFKYGIVLAVVAIFVFYLWPKFIKPMMNPEPNTNEPFNNTIKKSGTNKSEIKNNTNDNGKNKVSDEE